MFKVSEYFTGALLGSPEQEYLGFTGFKISNLQLLATVINRNDFERLLNPFYANFLQHFGHLLDFKFDFLISTTKQLQKSTNGQAYKVGSYAL